MKPCLQRASRDTYLNDEQLQSLDDSRRYLVLVAIMVDIFPSIFRHILNVPGIAAQKIYSRIISDKKFNTRLTLEEYVEVHKMPVYGYDNLNMALMLKIIVHYSNIFVDPPTRGWGSTPVFSEITIGDDLQRLRLFRNDLIHRVSTNMSEMEFQDKCLYLKTVFERIDLYCQTTQNESLTLKMEKLVTSIFQIEGSLLSKDLTKVGLKEQFVVEVASNTFKVYRTTSLKDLLEKLKKEPEIPTGLPITLTFPKLTSSELSSIRDDLKEEINENLVNIQVERFFDG